MTAPDHLSINIKLTLAKGKPSTHDPKRTKTNLSVKENPALGNQGGVFLFDLTDSTGLGCVVSLLRQLCKILNYL